MKTGDSVFLKAVGNNARGRKDTHVEEFKVGKIGRKYFDVYKEGREDYPIKFRIEDKRQHTSYSPDWKLYASKQEILDEQEFVELSNDIRKVFETYGKVNLTLDQLRRINQIMNE